MGLGCSTVPSPDITLLYLERSPNGTPLGIADRLLAPRSVATAFGWGSLGSGGPGVNRLRRVELPARGIADCRAAYFGAFDPETMVCAETPGRDTCFGDSGGPLVFEGQLIEVASFGRGCGFWPGVYFRADRLLPRVRMVVSRDTFAHRRAKLLAGKRR